MPCGIAALFQLVIQLKCPTPPLVRYFYCAATSGTLSSIFGSLFWNFLGEGIQPREVSSPHHTDDSMSPNIIDTLQSTQAEVQDSHLQLTLG